jgi:hypothetical protein
MTAKEHFLCHKLLLLIYPGEKCLIYALWMMANGSNSHRNNYLEVSIKDYEYCRNLYSELRKGFVYTEEMRKKMSESQKEKIGEKNSFYGRKHTEESKKKMSERAKNRKVSEETRLKMSKSRKGRKHTEESKKLMSEKMKGIKKKKIICDICNNEISVNSLSRHKNSCIKKNDVGDSH